jgi:hypothetical protein
MSILTDEEIAALISEPKPEVSLADLVPRTAKRGHRGVEKEVEATSGARFRLIVRQNLATVEDFSVILAYSMPQVHRLFRLRRHNGPSHYHPNKLEGDLIQGSHVHIATQRYQQAGFKEDAYAVVTNKYGDLTGAIEYMLVVANFAKPAQGTIFHSD